VIRVGVVGARGRMGSEVCTAVSATHDMTLVGGVDVDDDLGSLVDAGIDVAVDFTHPDAVMATIERLVPAGIHLVVGTTGFDGPRLERVRTLIAPYPHVGVLIAANFSLAAVLMMRFAAIAAPYFESAEIIELHHPDKADAPSGTARRTAELMAATGRAASPDATAYAEAGARGASVEGIAVHSVRLRGLLAHQEVLFGSPGETLTIRHDSTDRSSFMPGVLLAVRTVPERPGLTLGLDDLL